MTRGERVALVVNDDPIQVQMVSVLLEREGIRPISFLSAEEALEELVLTLAENGVVGSIVVDGIATRLLDLYDLTRISFPSWFEGVNAASRLAPPSAKSS